MILLDDSSFLSVFLIALVGGLATAVLIPWASYYVVRCLNSRKVIIEIEPMFQTGEYSTNSLRVRNNAGATLKNSTVYIEISYLKSDIVAGSDKESYNTTPRERPLMLSWPKFSTGQNLPELNINQGDVADINLFRCYKTYIEIASESGFNNNTGGKARVYLTPKDYDFEILLTAENIFSNYKEVYI